MVHFVHQIPIDVRFAKSFPVQGNIDSIWHWIIFQATQQTDLRIDICSMINKHCIANYFQSVISLM